MSVTVRDVIHLPIFQNSVRVVGGSSGLSNEVMRVSVMEVADFYTYDFEHGLFLLSTFSCFQNDKKLMIRAFRGLAEKKLSGILLKLNRFIEDIPPQLIEIADQYGVPLIVTEENIKFRDAIYFIISGICNEQMASVMIYELLFNHQNDGEYVRERLRLLGYIPSDNCAVIALVPNPGVDSSEAWHKLRDLSDLVRSTIPGCVMHPVGRGSIIICPLPCSGKPETMQQLRKSAVSIIERAGCEQIFRAGCSRVFSDLCDLGSAWTEAKQAVSYGRLISPRVPVSLYDDFFEIEMVSHILGTEEHRRLHNEVIVPVEEYDRKYHSELWVSIGECFSSRTLKDAAEALFIHISTLRYRLGKIQELTGFDFFDESDKYILRTAYILSLVENAENNSSNPL